LSESEALAEALIAQMQANPLTEESVLLTEAIQTTKLKAGELLFKLVREHLFHGRISKR